MSKRQLCRNNGMRISDAQSWLQIKSRLFRPNLLDELVKGLMTAQQVDGVMHQLKEGADELSHYLGYPPGAAKLENAINQRH